MNSKQTIAYQGSSGSYSEELLKKEYPNYLYHPTETFTELISYVKSDSGIGLLPVENSIAGTVNEAYEELIDSGLKILAEYVLRINHSLIGLVGSDLVNITNVISHPQALQQCSKFIQKHNLRITPVFDTAGSVFEILENNELSTAAIAGDHFESDERHLQSPRIPPQIESNRASRHQACKFATFLGKQRFCREIV